MSGRGAEIRRRHASWFMVWSSILGAIIASGCDRQGAGDSGASKGTKQESIESLNLYGAQVSPPSHFQWLEYPLGDGKFQFQHGMQQQLYTAVEVIGGGVGAIDYDRDGDWDFCFAGGGQISPARDLSGVACGFFRTVERWNSRSISSAACIEQPAFYHHGVLVADFDNDGFSDLFFSGYQGLALHKNMGDGTFVEVTHLLGPVSRQWGVSAAAGDFDRDGNLDLFLANYLDWSKANDPACSQPNGKKESCGPGLLHGQDDRLWLNDGEGGFVDRSSSFGLQPGGNGLGVLPVDINRDGWLDLYVANDATPNFLYRNEAGKTFTEIGFVSGVGLGADGSPTGSMGLAVGDVDGNSEFDLWVTNFEDEAFEIYCNQGDTMFVAGSRRLGVEAVGRRYVGWGTSLVDLDHDGDQDVVAVTGHVERHAEASPFLQLPLQFENQAGKRMQAQSSAGDGYFAKPHSGRGLAVGDWDSDGDVDLAISHLESPPVVLENVSGRRGRFLQLELIGRTICRDATGVTVVAQYDRIAESGDRSDEIRQVGQVIRAGSFASTHTGIVHLGLGKVERIRKLTIQWYPGKETVLEDVAVDQYLRIVEP